MRLAIVPRSSSRQQDVTIGSVLLGQARVSSGASEFAAANRPAGKHPNVPRRPLVGSRRWFGVDAAFQDSDQILTALAPSPRHDHIDLKTRTADETHWNPMDIFPAAHLYLLASKPQNRPGELASSVQGVE